MTDTSATGAASATTEEIRAKEDERYRAMVAGDLDALSALFADDMTYTHSNGVVDTKASFIDALRSGRLRYRSARRLEENVRSYGDTAIVTGRVQLDATIGDADRTVDVRYTAVWVQRGGAWRYAAWQSTPSGA